MEKTEPKEPNKLIIIGNGFDRAHGLPTSYQDFMLWTINFSYKAYLRKDFDNSFLDSASKGSLTYKYSFTEFESIEQFLQNSNTNKDFVLKNRFFKNLLDNQYLKKWVDIENEYFNFLVDFFESKVSVYDKYTLDNLNSDFEQIRQLLEKYLLTLVIQERNSGVEDTLIQVFEKELKNVNTKKKYRNVVKPIFVLNFNYTKTILLYTNAKLLETLLDLVNIHGELDSTENPIIFGYGDDSDSKYKELEQCGHNEYLKYIKDFEYLKTQNYSKMESFVEAEPFEVYIMGHSCGKSDRTLLKFIFQHKNCQKIYIKYKDEQDYFDKTKEIARAFDNKTEFRKKVASIKNTPNVGPLVS